MQWKEGINPCPWNQTVFIIWEVVFSRMFDLYPAHADGFPIWQFFLDMGVKSRPKVPLNSIVPTMFVRERDYDHRWRKRQQQHLIFHCWFSLSGGFQLKINKHIQKQSQQTLLLLQEETWVVCAWFPWFPLSGGFQPKRKWEGVKHLNFPFSPY